MDNERRALAATHIAGRRGDAPALRHAARTRSAAWARALRIAHVTYRLSLRAALAAAILRGITACKRAITAGIA